MEVQGTQMTEAALKKRSQGIWIRRISAMMSALLACALFYVLMKPAITMENGNGGGNGAQLVCTVPEHVHTEQCWGYDHPETEPVYGLSRELECSFVPHVHDMDCYDEAGELICGISERYIHVHDDLCYDQGNLVCLLEESPWNPEEEAVQEQVLVCDLPETAGHVHTDACYTVTYLTDEEPVCGLKEGGHVHTEDCYGPVLICEQNHEHTDECYAEGLVCHLEEGSEHVHTLSCYPSIRELTCGLEETEGHVHDENCYAFLTVEKEPHVHTEECYADDQLICGEMEIRSHQHTEACWHETQVMLSGGHVHNSECVKVLLCGMQEHVHTRECYSGPEAEIQLLLAENADTEKNGEAAQEADADMQEMLLEEEQLLTEDMDAAGDGVHLEDGEVIRTDETEPLQEEDGVLLSEEEELFSEWELVNEDPEWEDVQWEEESVQEMSDDGHETSASQEVSEEPTEPEHAVTDDAAESPASEQITEDPTETENSATDDAAGSRFEEAHYLQDVETLEDGVFSVHLHEDEGVYFRTILEKAGVEAEPVDVTSDIPFLDIREDSFVCRFAFTEGSVVIRAGGEDLTVKCTYAGPRTETENIAETGEAESSAETAADGLDNHVNAEVETGEDSAEGTDTEPGEKEVAGNVHAEETVMDGQEDGTQTEGAAGEVPAGETDTEHLDGDAAGEDSTGQTAADGQEDGTRSEDASGDNPAEGTGADQADSDAAGEDRAEYNAADGQEHRTESEDGTEETSAGEIDAESEGNEAAGETGTEDALTFIRELEKVVDGVYSVRLSLGNAVRLGDIPEMEGIAPEEIIISSEIEDMETGTDYFACRKAFEQGNVILTSGDIRVTVQCTYVPAAEEYEAGSADAAVDGIENAENGETGDADAENSENASENADTADETGNAYVSGEQGQDAAEPEIQDMARVLLKGEETDLLRLEENPEDAETVLDMLRTYLALEASESQETGLEEDAAAAESDSAENDEETRVTISRVFRVEAEEVFEGTAGIYMPVHARFSDLLPEGSYLTSVNCQLFHIDLDHGEILPVQNFEVEINDEEIVSLAFETERTGIWVLLCTLDYAFEEHAAVLTLDFSDFDALMLEDTEETGISVIEAEPEMNAEPAPGRRLLTKGRNNGQKKEENSSGFGGISIDLARLLEAVYAQNGAGEGEFQGIRMLMENLAGAEVSLETLVQEMSEGGVNYDGMSLQILDNGSILLRGKHMTLTIRIQGFAREKQEIYAYTFGEQKTVSMSEIFRASGMPEQFVPARFAYEVSDEELVTLIREGNDWQVTANRSFDEVKLFVRRGWYSGMILLRNPGNMVKPGTEIRSSDGAVSIVLNEEAVLPEGTELTVQPSEGMDIRPVLDQDFGENADVQVKWFDISLGDVHEIQAVVTLHGVIDVPEFAKKRGNVQARVYHAGSSGLEVLDAEVHGTDISFVTNGFSEFAVAYTVDFHWEMNGETYEFTLTGGGAVSLTRLLSALGFQEMLASDDLENTVQTDEGNAAAEETVDGEVLVIHDAEDSSIESEEVAGNETDNSIGRNLQEFTEQIHSVSFSDPSLVWTGKAETDTTIGQMKVDYGIACLLSSDMTADMLEEANNMQITAGDWALISLMPFTSEESLTVTMKNGDVFVIRVTDAQIRKTVISASGEAYEITVTFDDDAGIPDTADLVVHEIMEEDPEYAAYYAAASEHVNATDTESEVAAAKDATQETNGSGNARREIAQARFFDIEIWNDGSKIEPLKPVSVEIRLVDSAELDDAMPEVLHFAKSGLEIMDYTDKSTDENGRVFVFETDGFSVYSVIYTVDFEYSVDGQVYQFSLPGGGFVSFTQLVEVLGIFGDTNTDENGDENGSAITENAEGNAANEGAEENSVNSETNTSLTLGGVEVSEATRNFVADVTSVEFSNSELVDVSRVEADTTVGQIKDSRGLEYEYSAELTEEQIAEINAQTVEAGDWALISVQPFTSEETLTVTMKNGDQFVVRVTDAQISAHVITARGEHYRITVTYDEDAKIPDGSQLVAREILEGTEEYEKYLEEAAVQWEEAEREGFISYARFFNLEIQKDGKKVEPEAPVEVEIDHEDGFTLFNDEALSIIHFADNGTEIIDELHRNEEGTEIVYEQNGFSVIGTVSTVKDSGWPTANGQYVLVLQDGDDYYALKQDGTLTKIRYFNNTVSFIGEGTTTTDYINDYLWYVVSSGNRGKISDEYTEYNATPVGQTFIDLNNENIFSGASRQLFIRDGKIYCSGQLPGSSSYTQVSLSVSGGQLSRVALTSDDASPVLFAKASSFTANENETDLFTQIEVESIIDKWRGQKIQEATYDKTAEVYDYENRIYRVDVSASSSDYEVSPSIALEFVVDASRSMFYPTKIEQCGTLSANSNTELQNWLNANGDINKTYFVVNNPNTDATQIALFYNPAETKHWYRQGSWQYYEGEPYGTWEWTDASNYNPPDGNKAIGNVLNRWSYGNLDLNVYETDMLSYSYEENYGTRGTYVSRIEYLKQCVRVASQVIYAVDDNAQIGLIGFNRYITDYGTYGKNEQETLLSKLDNINLDGGTNQEGGLAQAVSKFLDSANSDKYEGRKHVVVLVTDGAPNYTYPDGGHQVTWETIGTVAEQLKRLKDDFGNDTELYTMGLSLSNVGTNQSGLFGVSSGTGYTYAAEDAAQIINAVTKMVDGIFVQANLVADVADVIDPAFYPVDKADGRPLAENDWINLSGTKVNAGANDAAGQIKKDSTTGNWYVEWKNQSIDWPTIDSNGGITEPGWHGTVFVKAKEDFLGGNGISTNAEGSQLEATKYIVRGETEPHTLPEGEHTTSFETPYVNVDELDITKNDTEWTVYLGTNVDPLKEVKALWEKVKVKEVVTKTDSDHRMSSDGSLTYQYSANTNDNRPETNGREEFSISDLGITLTDDDWADLIAGNVKTFDYSAYDHSTVGTIMVSLTQAVKPGEKDLSESSHDTTVTGDDVEKYTLTVRYRPKGVNITNWHTGSYGSGMSGSRAGNISKDNTHIINVYVKGLQITKVDLSDRILTGAKFALYRTVRDGETDLLEIDGGQYCKVADLDTSSTGIAMKGQIEQLMEGEQYYLVETQVPAGYNAIPPIPVNLSISDAYIPKQGTTTQTTKPDSGIYDWTQNASLVLNAESGVKRTNADNTADLTHSAVTANSDMETIYYRITNNPGVELPSTGGPGTRLYTILGTILIAGAGMLLWRRRRLV